MWAGVFQSGRPLIIPYYPSFHSLSHSLSLSLPLLPPPPRLLIYLAVLLSLALWRPAATIAASETRCRELMETLQGAIVTLGSDHSDGATDTVEVWEHPSHPERVHQRLTTALVHYCILFADYLNFPEFGPPGDLATA